MAEQDLYRLIAELDEDEYDPETRAERGIGTILKEILFHARHRFWQFTPAIVGYPQFTDRLVTWLCNKGITKEYLKVLLRMIPHIEFIDRDDMLALHRAAYVGPISRWYMDELGLNFSVREDQLRKTLNEAARATWFISLSDSMDIAQFHHVNNLSSRPHRPTAIMLNKFGDVRTIKQYIEKGKIKRLVVLEDFVGSGTQCKGPLEFHTAQFSPKISILFVPFVISEVGLREVQKLSGRKGFRIEPVFVIPRHAHLRATARDPEPDLFPKLRQVVNDTFDKVKLAFPPETQQLQRPFGFKSIGTLVVLYTNCPNNTLPLLWHQAPEWSPLFRRVNRS